MPFVGNDFQTSRGEAYAYLTDGKYGREYAEAMQELTEFENGIRQYYADKLRKLALSTPDQFAGISHAAIMLDPYNSTHVRKPPGFDRTTLNETGIVTP